MSFLSYPDARFASLRDVPVIHEPFFTVLSKILHIEFSTPSGAWVSESENKQMLSVLSFWFNANPHSSPVPLMQLKALPGALQWNSVVNKATKLKRKVFTLRECFFGLAMCLCDDKKTFFDGKKHFVAIPFSIDRFGVVAELALCVVNDSSVSIRPNRIFIADMDSYREIAEKHLIYWFTAPEISPSF